MVTDTSSCGLDVLTAQQGHASSGSWSKRGSWTAAASLSQVRQAQMLGVLQLRTAMRRLC